MNEHIAIHILLLESVINVEFNYREGTIYSTSYKIG